MKYEKWSKRDAINNYFPLPNEIFHLGLQSGEILVYAYLMYCEDRITYQCYPSYGTIGKAVGMSKNTVRKYVASLEEKRLITTEHTTIRTRDGRKHNGSLLYTIRPIQEAMSCYDERQLSQAAMTVKRAQVLKALEVFDRDELH